MQTLVELKRVGHEKTLYTFTIPTWFWLCLSIPSHYYWCVRKFISLSRNYFGDEKGRDTSKSETSNRLTWWKYLLPRGHPNEQSFWESFLCLRQKFWKNKFKKEFEIIDIIPILIYGPSEWPILPTMKVDDNAFLTSSTLYILKFNNEEV